MQGVEPQIIQLVAQSLYGLRRPGYITLHREVNNASSL